MPKKESITDEQTTAYFDAIAETRGVNASANADKYEVIQFLLKGRATHPSILECGGGGGFYTRRFLQDGYVVTCIDLSSQALQENKRQAELIGATDRLRLVGGDFAAEAVQLREQFDQVVFIKVLHHFPSLKEIEEALAAGLAACKPGGQLVIFEPNGKNPFWKLFLSLVRDKKSGQSKWFYEQNLRLTTRANLERILCKHGAVPVTQHRFVLPAFLLQKRLLGVGMLRKINSLLERSVFKRMAFNIAVTVQVRR